MRFDVYGPFTIERFGRKKLITKDSIDDLLSQFDNEKKGLSDSCGCYVFALRAGKGYTPYYVGQTHKQSIAIEALNPSNISKYNGIQKYGTPVIFAIPLLTPKGAFRDPEKVKGRLASVDFLERWLIRKCLEKNWNLLNNKETAFLRKIEVRGIFNSGRGDATKHTTQLKKAIE